MLKSPRKIDIVVSGKPAPKGSMRSMVSAKTGRIITMNNSATTKWWGQRVTVMAAEKWTGPPLNTAVIVDAQFFFERPKSHRNRHGQLKPDAPRFPTSRRCGDVDKLWRCVLDALTGVVFVDDSLVCGGNPRKQYAADGLPSGVIINVRELE